MRQLRALAAREPRAPCVILLPGALQQPEELIHHGFAAAVAARGLDLELRLVAPELAHLTDRDYLSALAREVVAPARVRGGPLWLGGISLGAFMALRFMVEHAEAIDGLCLIAPYLGDRQIAREIQAQGALAQWRAPPRDADDDERRVWHAVRTLPARCAVYLGLAQLDRFGDTQRVLAENLPQATLARVEGGHDWPQWRQLWDNFLMHLAATASSRP